MGQPGIMETAPVVAATHLFPVSVTVARLSVITDVKLCLDILMS